MATGAVPGTATRTSTTPRAWWGRHRERVDDVVLVVTLLLGAALVVALDVSTGLTATTWTKVALTLLVAGGLAWRRRHPLAMALLAAAAVAAGASAVAVPVALLNLAVRRRGRWLVVAAAAALLASLWHARRASPPDGLAGTLVSAVSYGALLVGLPVAVGAYVGARRDLVSSLRERAERAEAEQSLRAGRARLAERTRIAQEMHDVLAHRITLVALHAGGLEVNPSAGAGEVERAAALIRTTARAALEDLRGVLGVLRDDASPTGAELAPQPTVVDVGDLVASSTAAGAPVRLLDELPADSEPPALAGRTAYRVVQEGLTNAHKHAPGTVAVVRLSGGPGAGLQAEVRNARAVGSRHEPLVPGAGLGLVGLRERVQLVGGSLEAGAGEGGSFLVRARLPWPAGTPTPGEPAPTAPAPTAPAPPEVVA